MKIFLSVFFIVVFAIAAYGQTKTGGIDVNNTLTDDCQFKLDPPVVSVGGGDRYKAITVFAKQGCSWTATSNTDWITVTSGASGNGYGVVIIYVSLNLITVPEFQGLLRSGTVTIAGQTLTVNYQKGCSYTLTSPDANFEISGGIGSVTVNTFKNCAVSASSYDSFININERRTEVTGRSLFTETIAYTVSFTIPPNTGVAKRGIIYVAGQTFTINQAGFSKSRARVKFPESKFP